MLPLFTLKNQDIDVTTRIGTIKLMKLQEREYFNNTMIPISNQYSTIISE